MSTDCEFYTEFDYDTLRIQLSILAVSYHSFRQGEGVADTMHNVVDFLKKKKKGLVPHTRGPILGQDYSGYASNKCQLWRRLQCTEKGEVLSPYSHVEQLSQSSYDMHTVHKELVKELNLKQVTMTL